MTYLIINADGYGLTAGVTRGIEECVAFGTVRSISVNVNFRHAEALSALAKKYPELSIGCHVNPVVGPPVLSPSAVGSLLNEEGEFLYRDFTRSVLRGRVRMSELYREMVAQIRKTQELAGRALSHVDFHRGVHRLPGVYAVFLEAARACGVKRVRTHRYVTGLGRMAPTCAQVRYLARRPFGAVVYLWNLWLDRRTRALGFASPDRRVEPDYPKSTAGLREFRLMLRRLPAGFNELVVHPGYVDAELGKYSTYVHQREGELAILTDPAFKEALSEAGVVLAGYKDIRVVGA